MEWFNTADPSNARALQKLNARILKIAVVRLDVYARCVVRTDVGRI